MTAGSDARPATRRWVPRLLVAALVCEVLSGNSARVGLPVPPDRVLLLAALGLLVLGGGAAELRRLRWRAVHTAMALMVLWVVWSAMGHGTLHTSYGAFALLDRILIPFALFVLAPVLLQHEEDRRFLLRALVLLGLYLGVTAVLEMLGATSLVWPRYVMDPDVGILFGRARGPFVEAEADGMVLAACCAASVLSAVRSRGAWRVLSALGALVSVLGVLLTLTRSVWIGTVVGTLVVVLLLPSLRRRALLLAAGAASALGLVLWTVPALTERVLHRATTEGSVYDRQNTNAAALRVIAEHPLDGLGWTRFLTQGTDWVRQADTYPVTNVDIEVHNVVLARAAELGLPGAVLWVACVLAGPGLAFLRRPADPDLAGWRVVFCAYASVWLVCTMVSPVPYVLANNLLWLLAGTLLAGHLTRSGPPPVTEPATEPVTPAVTSPDPAVPAAMGR